MHHARKPRIGRKRPRWPLLAIFAAAAGLAVSSANAGIAHNLRAGVQLQMGSANIYSDTADAKADIRAALLKAADEHKRVILEFGGNWCVDCQLLNLYFHDPSNAGLLAANYVLVHIDVGEYDKNLDLVQKYAIPLNLGVPALVVLDSTGRLVYAQRHAEFEKIHQLDSTAVTAFLQKWKPVSHSARPGVTHSARHAKASSKASGK